MEKENILTTIVSAVTTMAYKQFVLTISTAEELHRTIISPLFFLYKWTKKINCKLDSSLLQR
jgi:hypothetical protein